MNANVAPLNTSVDPSAKFHLSDLKFHIGKVEKDLDQMLRQVNTMMNQVQHRKSLQDAPPPEDLNLGLGSLNSGTQHAAQLSALPTSKGDTVTPSNASSQSVGSASSVAPAGLSAAPQTSNLTPQESHQVAEQYISNLQKDFGLTRDQASGIVANLWHESGGMNSGINQGGKIGAPSSNMADDNGNGYGIAQWGGSRKQGLIDFAQQHGLDPSSQAANYGFLKQELQTSYSGSIDAVKHTNSAEAATKAFSSAFEQPSDPQMASRIQDLKLV
jgi:hypothetical protein